MAWDSRNGRTRDSWENRFRQDAAQEVAAHGAAGYRFKLVAFDQIELRRDCAYLVQGIIPREGLTVVWGPPKCGKSFVVFDLTMHVALGWEFRGRRVSQGRADG